MDDGVGVMDMTLISPAPNGEKSAFGCASSPGQTLVSMCHDALSASSLADNFFLNILR